MTLATFLSLDLTLVELFSFLLTLLPSQLHISSHLLTLLSLKVRASLDLLAVKNFDELIHWLVYFRCKLNQWNRSLDRQTGHWIFVWFVLAAGHLPAHPGKDNFPVHWGWRWGVSQDGLLYLPVHYRYWKGSRSGWCRAKFTTSEASHLVVKFPACQVFSNDWPFSNKNVKYQNEFENWQPDSPACPLA